MLEQDVAKIVKKKGLNNAKTFLDVLSRNRQFKAANETPIGQELMTDLLRILKDGIELILSNKDTPETRAEIKVCREILARWSNRIAEADKGEFELKSIIERN